MAAGTTFASFLAVAAATAALASGLSDLRLCADQECQGKSGGLRGITGWAICLIRHRFMVVKTRNRKDYIVAL